MPKKTSQPLQMVSMRLVQGDADTLREFYPSIGYNAAARTLIHRHCRALRERASREGLTVGPMDQDLDAPDTSIEEGLAND